MSTSYTSLSYQLHECLRPGYCSPDVPYLTKQQNARRELIRRRRMLFKGQHRQFFLVEDRTQFSFDRLRVEGSVIKPYRSTNLLKLISTTYADLLLGEEPKLTSEDPAQQQIIDDLAKRSDLGRVFYDAIVSASWSGEAMAEICRYDGQVYIQTVPTDEIYPIGRRLPDGQYARYERYTEAASADGKTRYVLITTYSASAIDRACFKLDDKGNKGQPVGLDQWPAAEGLLDHEPTGVDVPTIVWMGNEIDDEGNVTSDYTADLLEAQDQLNHAETLLAVVLNKHGMPKMYALRSQADASGGINTGQGVFFVNSKDEAPGYIVWNAELGAAMENRDSTKLAMATISELTPGLLGIDKGAVPESAEKLRLACTKAVARTKRKAKYAGPFIRTALDTARAMIGNSTYLAIEQSASAVSFRDGLPVDEESLARRINLLNGGKAAMSVRRSVELQIEDPDEVDKELELIGEDNAASAPATFGGLGLNAFGAEPGQQEPAAAATDPADNPTGASPAAVDDKGAAT